LDVTFYGVRGSTPCSCEENRRYGGNTACVALDIPGSEPIVLDMGTGLRFWGQHLPADRLQWACEPPSASQLRALRRYLRELDS